MASSFVVQSEWPASERPSCHQKFWFITDDYRVETCKRLSWRVSSNWTPVGYPRAILVLFARCLPMLSNSDRQESAYTGLLRWLLIATTTSRGHYEQGSPLWTVTITKTANSHSHPSKENQLKTFESKGWQSIEMSLCNQRWLGTPK